MQRGRNNESFSYHLSSLRPHASFAAHPHGSSRPAVRSPCFPSTSCCVHHNLTLHLEERVSILRPCLYLLVAKWRACQREESSRPEIPEGAAGSPVGLPERISHPWLLPIFWVRNQAGLGFNKNWMEGHLLTWFSFPFFSIAPATSPSYIIYLIFIVYCPFPPLGYKYPWAGSFSSFVH